MEKETSPVVYLSYWFLEACAFMGRGRPDYISVRLAKDASVCTGAQERVREEHLSDLVVYRVDSYPKGR